MYHDMVISSQAGRARAEEAMRRCNEWYRNHEEEQLCVPACAEM